MPIANPNHREFYPFKGSSTIKLGNHIFVIAGETLNGGFLNSCMVYNMENDTWIYHTLGSFPFSSESHTFLEEDTIYIYPGNRGRTYLPLSRLYTIQMKDGVIINNSIALNESVKFPFNGAFTSYNKKLYSFGGMYDNNKAISELTVLEPSLCDMKTLSYGSGFPPELVESSLVVFKNHLWLFGGLIQSLNQVQDRLYIFPLDVDSKSTSQKKSSLLQSSRQILSELVNNKLFADVVFETKDGVVYAHKSILAARVSLFRHFFTSQLPDTLQFRSDSILDISTGSSYSSSSGYGSSTLQYIYNGKKKIEELGIEADVFDMKEHSTDMLKAALKYIYTGEISINTEDIDKLGYIAYDLKLLNILSLVENKVDYINGIHEPLKNVLKSFRRMVGNPIGSDIYFVLNKRQKIYGHKIFLYMFTLFKSFLEETPNAKYIEIGIKDVNLESFIEYCRLMYSNFSAKATSKKKFINYADILAYAENLGDDIASIFNSNMINDRSIGPILKYAMTIEDENKKLKITDEVCNYFRQNASSIVRDKAAVKNINSEIIQYLKSYMKSKLFNPLDELWFAYHSEDNELTTELADKMQEYINTDNVIFILINSHQMGLKNLRSTCLDYLLIHAETIERNRMLSSTEFSFHSISNLSESLNQEYANKLRNKMKKQVNIELIVKIGKKKSSTCYICTTDFTFEKKRKCKMCKRESVCPKCLNYKMVLPKVIGIKGEVKVCKLCRDLAMIIKE